MNNRSILDNPDLKKLPFTTPEGYWNQAEVAINSNRKQAKQTHKLRSLYVQLSGVAAVVLFFIIGGLWLINRGDSTQTYLSNTTTDDSLWNRLEVIMQPTDPISTEMSAEQLEEWMIANNIDMDDIVNAYN